MDRTSEREGLLTSGDAARYLGVGATSVKRWADAGLLRCERTSGKHRRFSIAEVERFKHSQSIQAPPAPLPEEYEPGDPRIENWLKELTQEVDPNRFTSLLMSERARLGAWWRVADEMGPVLDELGERCANGRINILHEHLAAERLSRALSSICERYPTHPSAPRALLTVAEGEEHLLGLGLVELCLAEADWCARWVGRYTPVDAVCAFLRDNTAAMLAISASSHYRDAASLADQVRRLTPVCLERNVTLVLGGEGPWPDRIPCGVRLRTFTEFHEFLAKVTR
ncbi:MAG: helix-turn-helix domain-containing protein [Myxococcales bacterium]|nr:helix-turn-helix domain-containing protein [Myxococcales bacterium]